VTGGANTGTGVATFISENGLLAVATDESAALLSVTVKSVYDPAKSASVLVTLDALTVRFYNGASVVRTDSVGRGAMVTPPALPANTDGSVVKGWYTASSGGIKIVGATPPITENTNFYAQRISLSDFVPLNAMGGEVKFISTSTGFDEVHIFRESGSFVLLPAVIANVLVVGGGGASYPSSGGGAGGYVGHTAYPMSSGAYTITVVAGGAGTASSMPNDASYASSGGGAGKSNSITGDNVTYAAGGNRPGSVKKDADISWSPSPAPANSGNGGEGAWNRGGGSSGSGIVVIRFPYQYIGY
jgi:hypothetical protein